MRSGGGQHGGDRVRVLVSGHGDGGVDAGGSSLWCCQVVDNGSFGPGCVVLEHRFGGICLDRRGGTVGCPADSCGRLRLVLTCKFVEKRRLDWILQRLMRWWAAMSHVIRYWNRGHMIDMRWST